MGTHAQKGLSLVKDDNDTPPPTKNGSTVRNHSFPAFFLLLLLPSSPISALQKGGGIKSGEVTDFLGPFFYVRLLFLPFPPPPLSSAKKVGLSAQPYYKCLSSRLADCSSSSDGGGGGDGCGGGGGCGDGRRSVGRGKGEKRGRKADINFAFSLL